MRAHYNQLSRCSTRLRCSRDCLGMTNGIKFEFKWHGIALTCKLCWENSGCACQSCNGNHICNKMAANGKMPDLQGIAACGTMRAATVPACALQQGQRGIAMRRHQVYLRLMLHQFDIQSLQLLKQQIQDFVTVYQSLLLATHTLQVPYAEPNA